MYLSAQNGMRPRSGMMYLSGRASSKTRRSLGRYSLRGLGALTADQATEQVFPAAQVKTSAGHNQSVRDQILASVNAGQILNAQGGSDYVPGTGQCSMSKNTGQVALQSATGVAGGLLLKIGAASGNPIILASGAAAEIASLVFSVIFGHHRAAVAKEQTILCAAVPAANESLQVISQAVQSGQFTPQQGIQALQTMLQQFGSAVASIRQGASPTSSGQCNAACVEYAKLNAIVIYMTSQFQDMAAASSSAPASSVTTGVTSVVENVAASTGIPPIALYAIGGLLLWKLIGQ